MIKNSHEPEWNQHFESPIVPKSSKIILKISDFDVQDEDDGIGVVEVEINELIQRREIGRRVKKKIPFGWIQFQVFWHSAYVGRDVFTDASKLLFDYVE